MYTSCSNDKASTGTRRLYAQDAARMLQHFKVNVQTGQMCRPGSNFYHTNVTFQLKCEINHERQLETDIFNHDATDFSYNLSQEVLMDGTS